MALKKAVINGIGIVGVSVMSGPLLAASFDCAKASTKIEKMICTDAKVSQLDEQLAQAYKVVIESAEDKPAVKQAQRAWLKERNNSCKDASCLTQVYQSRISALNNKAVTNQFAKNSSQISASAVPEASAWQLPASKRIENQSLPLTFKLMSGNSYSICQPFVDMLNKTHYREYPTCERKLLPGFSQFKPVQWAEITDKKEIEKVMAKAVALWVARASEIGSASHQRVWRDTKLRIDSGKSKFYVTHFDFDKDGENEIIYKESVERTSGQKPERCLYATFYYVFDKKITVENIKKYSYNKYSYLSLSGNGMLFIYDNKVYSSEWGNLQRKFDIYIHGDNAELVQVCGIKIK